MSVRQIIQSPVEQGEDEEIVYTITTTPWASNPTSPSVAVFDASADNENVTADVTTGSASISGDVITLPSIGGLTARHTYRVDVQFTAGGNTWEPYFLIKAKA